MTAERVCFALLLLYLIWVPMPYGSNVDTAFLPLVIPPMLLCAAAALLRLRDPSLPPFPFSYRVWTAGLVGLVAVVALQLLPMPKAMLSLVSPRSSEIWSGADRLAVLAQVPPAALHPISIDPAATRRELLRLLAFFAALQAAALLVTTNTRRMVFAATLILTAMFETLYGVREAALRRYAIWGWVNKLIFNRVTGTFVNPNHFAHYVALALPFTMFIAALAWRSSGTATMPPRRRIVLLFEKSLPLFSAAAIAFAGCIAGILLGQSRGALAATLVGFAAIAMIVARRERHPHMRDVVPAKRRRRATAGVAAGLIALVGIVASLVFFLGYERTVARFEPSEEQRTTLVGRLTGFKLAVGVWRQFPTFGSGLGTFVDVSSTVQKDDLEHIYDHAHNDYLELLATTGIVGFCIAAGSLLAGLIATIRDVIRRPRESGSWRRRAFQMAALWSIFIAMAHAFFDFNLFIPANAATLAVIAGACAAPRLKAESREAAAPDAVPDFA